MSPNGGLFVPSDMLTSFRNAVMMSPKVVQCVEPVLNTVLAAEFPSRKFVVLSLMAAVTCAPSHIVGTSIT
jgi:hypothetical protein